MYLCVYLCAHRCAHLPPDGKPLTICPAYWKLKESITQYELYLLRVLRFNIKVDLPHQVGGTSEGQVFVQMLA